MSEMEIIADGGCPWRWSAIEKLEALNKFASLGLAYDIRKSCAANEERPEDLKSGQIRQGHET